MTEMRLIDTTNKNDEKLSKRLHGTVDGAPKAQQT